MGTRECCYARCDVDRNPGQAVATLLHLARVEPRADRDAQLGGCLIEITRAADRTSWTIEGGKGLISGRLHELPARELDAGVLDEKSIKALLINTAQKNEAGIDIEDDADGWDPAAGWGLMNAWAAYYHRGDVILDSVTPREQPGDYHLYSGRMRDEGPAGEGRDRATMVWNRHAT